MSEDEVEIEPEDDEEYEVVPLSPIRKLEKRIDEIEEKKDVGDAKGMVREVMDLVKANQKMVDDMVESNNELRKELEKIPEKINEVTDQWDEFLEILKKGGQETGGGMGASKDVKELVDLNKDLIEKNEEIVESMKSLKRSVRGNIGGGSSPKVRVKNRKKQSSSQGNKGPRVKVRENKENQGKEGRRK